MRMPLRELRCRKNMLPIRRRVRLAETKIRRRGVDRRGGASRTVNLPAVSELGGGWRFIGRLAEMKN
jgi:hypothetical protein